MIPDLKDIQGIIHHSYGYRKSRHLLFSITSQNSGRKLLNLLIPHITNAAQILNPRPNWALNVGISYSGLIMLGLKHDILKHFPSEFKELPSPSPMGDFGLSAPTYWWNNQFLTGDIHLVVHIYSNSTEGLDEIVNEIRKVSSENKELFPMKNGGIIDAGSISSTKGELHFGYRDGISQPKVCWSDKPITNDTIDFRHFLLGYATNEIPSSPREILNDLMATEAGNFVKNGSYSVFRLLYQDVAGFNRFLKEEGTKLYPSLPEKDAQELLAAKLMGRWRDGTPLVLSPNEGNASLANSDNFTYSMDEEGFKCPFSAHIRVTNPRDQQLDHTSQLLGGVPRVIRRGSPFGPKLEGVKDDGIERGLVGMFICSSIQRQFYKLTAWMKNNNFSPKFENLRMQDPFANRMVPGSSNKFLIPRENSHLELTLRNFVITKGTAFFLLPSINALNFLANGND